MLVPNAGVSGRVQSLEQVDLAMWQRTLAVNLTTPFVLASRVLPGMAERAFGRVLFVSSVAAFVTVNAIAPALVVSGMIAADQDSSAIPVGRLGSADEVVQLALVMLTSAYLTGKVYLLDGGLRAQ